MLQEKLNNFYLLSNFMYLHLEQFAESNFAK
jgi:hypothetical protein